MLTKVLPADDESIKEGAQLIRNGEIVAFPTETVYGLGANALDERAVKRIFEAKGRPGDNPLIVHVSSTDEITPLIKGEMPEAAKKLAERYWPGPMTLIMPKSDLIPDVVSAGLNTVGIRMPSNAAARDLISESGVPIAAPSANLSGKPSPTTAKHVYEDMAGRIPLILDGGPCLVGVESTVIDATCYPPRILRPGGITPEMVVKAAGDVRVDDSVLRPLKAGEAARSPGMKYKHYAPKAKLTIVKGRKAVQRVMELYDGSEESGENPCILSSGEADFGFRRVIDLGRNSKDVAARLFSALREADENGAGRIYSLAVDATGVGLAVMNRMGRAAAFDIIDTEE